jgi:hypothetical protein
MHPTLWSEHKLDNKWAPTMNQCLMSVLYQALRLDAAGTVQVTEHLFTTIRIRDTTFTLFPS